METDYVSQVYLVYNKVNFCDHFSENLFTSMMSTSLLRSEDDDDSDENFERCNCFSISDFSSLFDLQLCVQLKFAFYRKYRFQICNLSKLRGPPRRKSHQEC